MFYALELESRQSSADIHDERVVDVLRLRIGIKAKQLKYGMVGQLDVLRLRIGIKAKPSPSSPGRAR